LMFEATFEWIFVYLNRDICKKCLSCFEQTFFLNFCLYRRGDPRILRTFFLNFNKFNLPDPPNWKKIPVEIRTKAIMKKAICHSSLVPLVTIDPILQTKAIQHCFISKLTCTAPQPMQFDPRNERKRRRRTCTGVPRKQH
jgi:hypothetical protein